MMWLKFIIAFALSISLILAQNEVTTDYVDKHITKDEIERIASLKDVEQLSFTDDCVFDNDIDYDSIDFSTCSVKSINFDSIVFSKSTIEFIAHLKNLDYMFIRDSAYAEDVDFDSINVTSDITTLDVYNLGQTAPEGFFKVFNKVKKMRLLYGALSYFTNIKMGELQYLETVSFDNYINDDTNFEVLRNVTNVIVDNIYDEESIEYLTRSIKDFERIKYLEFTGLNMFNQAIVDNISSLVNLKELIIQKNTYNNYEPSCNQPLDFSGILNKSLEFVSTDKFKNECVANGEIETPKQSSSTITSTISTIIKPTSDDSNIEYSDDDNDEIDNNSNDEDVVEVDNNSEDDNDVVEVDSEDDNDVVEVGNNSEDDEDVVEIDDNGEDVVEVDNDI